MANHPKTLTLTPGEITLDALRQAWMGAAVKLHADAYADLDSAADSVARIVASGRTVYGLNTGFGLLANTRIPPEKLADLQRNLVLSHACGMGDDLSPEITRLVLILKVIGLSRGRSGVRREIVDRLLAFLDRNLLPAIPSQGSVGASGDLAPLAHMSAALLGVGRATFDGEEAPAADALESAGLKPLVLGPKEGLALLNGTQVSTAIALDAYFTAERVFDAALMAGALSVDALKGSAAPFDSRLHEARGQPGQINVAQKLLALLKGSDIGKSHIDCDRVQDPYSFRCQPQVMGAALDLMNNAARTLTIEANAVTDNPVIFPDTDESISGGNFHAQPVAFASDILTMAMCEVGSLSERRVAVLVDPKMSGLPAFLVEEGGLNSGFMIAQVASAALVSENKTLAFPASVDSIPTSANQEDHVSMATTAARKAGTVARNAAGVIGIELLAAAQGVEFHAPLETSRPLQSVLGTVRQKVARLDRDRYFSDDLNIAQRLVLDGHFAFE